MKSHRSVRMFAFLDLRFKGHKLGYFYCVFRLKLPLFPDVYIQYLGSKIECRYILNARVTKCYEQVSTKKHTIHPVKAGNDGFVSTDGAGLLE